MSCIQCISELNIYKFLLLSNCHCECEIWGSTMTNVKYKETDCFMLYWKSGKAEVYGVVFTTPVLCLECTWHEVFINFQ
jgi:hypothetical protein